MIGNRKIGLRSVRLHRPTIALVLGALLVTGCGSNRGQPPAKLAAEASVALDEGRVMRSIRLAEQALEADPRNGELRFLLGQAYLQAGRFASAKQAFEEAEELGQRGGKLALSKALAALALGRNDEALQTLTANLDAIPAADLGLALALAGQPGKGILILTDRLRQGETSIKLRQNLAFAYALDGRWLPAKVMAAQDVPASRLDALMTEWAVIVRPDASHRRLASLLKVPMMARDKGMPAALALKNAPSVEQLAAEATSPSTSAPVAEDHAAATSGGRYVVQLGSFRSRQGAQKALQEYRRTMPQLHAYRTTTARTDVDGKTYWRVIAEDFPGEQIATSTCDTIKASGGTCMVVSEAAKSAKVRQATGGVYGLDWRRLR